MESLVVRFLFCVFVLVFLFALYGRNWTLRQLRMRRYFRGRRLATGKGSAKQACKHDTTGLRFGNDYFPEGDLTGHALAAGTSGSGKSLVQRLFLERHLKNIAPGSDARVLIYDAKSEITAYLKRIGVKAPIYTMNPFDSRTESPIAVAWDIGKDITSPARADNLSHKLIKGETSDANSYFTKAARIVVAGIMKSFIRQSCTNWRFSDLVYATTSSERMKQVLALDSRGKEIVKEFLADNNTGYGVATTVAADMERYLPVAALWQRCNERLSIREFLKMDAILLLGENETAQATLDVLNEQIFCVYVEEVLSQNNSLTRRNGLWVDEAQEARAILRSGKLQSWALKARSRGGWMFLAFQDVEGFRLAAGDRQVADSIIAQCNFKALLRMESFESAEWGSKLTGQFEAIEVFRSESHQWQRSDPGSEQRVLRDAVLPSEYYEIPEASPENGLTGYFLSSRLGARKMTVPSEDVSQVVVHDSEELEYAIVPRPESDQWLEKWTVGDKQRLGLLAGREHTLGGEELYEQLMKKKRLKLKTRSQLEKLTMPSELSELKA